MRTEVIWQSWREVGLLPHQVLIWKKTRQRAHLLALHVGLRADDVRLARGPHAEGEAAGRRQGGLGDRSSDRGRRRGSIHPTQKPVETIRRPITYHTKPGGLIYEPFSGSGTALIAAEETGRTCYAIEQSPPFVDVAVARWEAFTGRQAQRG